MNQIEDPEIINKIWNAFKTVVLYLIPATVSVLITYYVRINLNFIFEIRSQESLIFLFAIYYIPLHFFAFRNKIKPLISYSLKYFIILYCILLIEEILASSYFGGYQSIGWDSLFRASLVANSLPAIVLHLVYSILRRQEDRLLKEYYYNQKK